MSVNILTDTSYLKGAPDSHQINARVYNLYVDNEIFGPTGGIPPSPSELANVINYSIVDPTNGKLDIYGLLKNTAANQTLLTIDHNNNHLFYSDALDNHILFSDGTTGTNSISSGPGINLDLIGGSRVSLKSGNNSISVAPSGTTGTITLGTGGCTASVQNVFINDSHTNTFTMNGSGINATSTGPSYRSFLNTLGDSTTISTRNISTPSIINQWSTGQNLIRGDVYDSSSRNNYFQLTDSDSILSVASRGPSGGVYMNSHVGTTGLPDWIVVAGTGNYASSFECQGGSIFMGATYNGNNKSLTCLNGVWRLTGLNSGSGNNVTYNTFDGTLTYNPSLNVSLVGTGQHLFVSGGDSGTKNFRGLTSPDGSITITPTSDDMQLTLTNPLPVPDDLGFSVLYSLIVSYIGATGSGGWIYPSPVIDTGYFYNINSMYGPTGTAITIPKAGKWMVGGTIEIIDLDPSTIINRCVLQYDYSNGFPAGNLNIGWSNPQTDGNFFTTSGNTIWNFTLGQIMNVRFDWKLINNNTFFPPSIRVFMYMKYLG